MSHAPQRDARAESDRHRGHLSGQSDVAVRRLNITVLVLLVAVTLAILAWLLHRCRYGFDLTDESFYLIWMADPGRYGMSTTQFGFVYNPLYRILGGDIASLRQANIALTFCCGWLLCIVLLRRISPGHRPVDFRTATETFLVAASLATCALVVYAMWIPTPSYNSLALQAILLAASGLVLLDRDPTRASICGWLLLSLGLVVTFLAKPPSAMALALVAVGYVAFGRKVNPRLIGLAVAAAAALLLVVATAMDGSALAFGTRLARGVEIARALEAGHRLDRLLRLDTPRLSVSESMVLPAVAFLVLVLTWLSFGSRRQRVFSVVGCGALLAASMAIISGSAASPLDRTLYMGLLIGGVALGTLSVAVVLARRSSRPWILGADRALAVALALLPYAYAVGTGNNYWRQGAGASIFWVLACAILLARTVDRSTMWQSILPTLAAAQLVTVAVLSAAMEQPYRQAESLRLQGEPIELGPTRSSLWLSRETAEYLRRVVALAHDAGFKPGTPMIDLTGHSPGTVFALAANAVGQPWIIGGYKGSEQFAAKVLDSVPCEELAAAWVLAEPAGPRKLDPALLRRYGIDLGRDYLEVGVLSTPLGVRDYPGIYEQRILKPARPAEVAVDACRGERKLRLTPRAGRGEVTRA